MNTLPFHERVAQRAYQIFEDSGRQHGHCTENWLRAEREIRETEQQVQTVPLDDVPAEPEVSAPLTTTSRRSGRR